MAVPDLLWSDVSPTRDPDPVAAADRGLDRRPLGQVELGPGRLRRRPADPGRRAAGPRPSRSRRAAVPCADPSPGQTSDLTRRLATTAGPRCALPRRPAGARRADRRAGPGRRARPAATPTSPRPLTAGLGRHRGRGRSSLAVDDAIYTAPPAARSLGGRGRRPPGWRPWSTRCPPARPCCWSAAATARTPPGERGGPPASAHLHVAIAHGPAFPPGWLTLAVDQARAVRRADRRRADGAHARGRARAVVGGRPVLALRRRADQRGHPGRPACATST